jgi:hypothetical protein
VNQETKNKERGGDSGSKDQQSIEPGAGCQASRNRPGSQGQRKACQDRPD